MDKRKEAIIRISDEILSFLLSYRNENPDFTFALRERDSVQSEESRLKNGQWFQGSDYIYVPLFKKGDSSRKIKTIGYVLTFDEEGEINKNYIEISLKSGVENKNEQSFHNDLANEIGLTLGSDNHGVKNFEDTSDYIKNLKEYVGSFRTKALSLLKKYSIEDKYLLSENQFSKNLSRIQDIKKNGLKRGIPNIHSTDMKNKLHLNQILFGPPGTGKTYHTINKALEIINDEEVKQLDWNSRTSVKELFDKKLAEGQIVFTTFHQSMSYEDFIEGIKPTKPLPEDKEVFYDVQKGIFYQLCDLARSNFDNSKVENKSKLSFEEAFEQFKEEWEENQAMKFPLKTQGYDFTITGFSTSSIQFRKASGGTSHTLSINTLKDLYYGKEMNFKQGVGIYYPSVLQKVLSYNNQVSKETKLLNYVLIIDEINRGNISQIFGELITLIEEDKRLGKDEALEVTLPYSKEKFGVPANLYIIGTMNTADRSVEALDTALRRRFSFTEMPPQPELLEPTLMMKRLWVKYFDLEWEDPVWIKVEKDFFDLHGVTLESREKYEALEEEKDFEILPERFAGVLKFNGLNLRELLKTINNRIEVLLDRDHLIGHSYFIKVNSWEDLRSTFYKNVIPLLQEYFFGDYAKIGAVIGKGFVKVKESENEPNIFADFEGFEPGDFNDKMVFEIVDYREKSTKHQVEKNKENIPMDFEKAIKALMNSL